MKTRPIRTWAADLWALLYPSRMGREAERAHQLSMYYLRAGDMKLHTDGRCPSDCLICAEGDG